LKWGEWNPNQGWNGRKRHVAKFYFNLDTQLPTTPIYQQQFVGKQLLQPYQWIFGPQFHNSLTGRYFCQ